MFSPSHEAPRPGVAIGDHILELEALAAAGLVREAPAALEAVLATPALRRSLRQSLSRLLSDVKYRAVAEAYLHKRDGLHPAPAGAYRRLHRFLCRHSSCAKRRRAVPAR
ncbi:MAG: hypothetical protein WDN06_16830 [Asticcacaulis sp.]